MSFYGDVGKVKNLSGVEPIDLGLEDNANPGQDLDNLIEEFLKQITSEINARIPQERVDEEDPAHDGIEGLAERKAVDLVSFARHQHQQPVVQVDDFAIRQINSSEVLNDLNKELEPYKELLSSDDGSGAIEVYDSIG